MNQKIKFKNFRMKQGLSQTSMAEKLEVSTGIIGMTESLKNQQYNVSANIKLKIKKAFNIDFDLNVNDDGEIIKREDNLLSSNIVKIPFYTFVKAAAGSGIDIPEYAEHEIMYFDKRWLKNTLGVNETNLSIITAEGDSMQPLINDGDYLLVDKSSLDITNNKVYVIQDGETYRVKRIRQDFNGDIYLISDNKNYLPEKVSHSLNIIGKVVWNSSKENV